MNFNEFHKVILGLSYDLLSERNIANLSSFLRGFEMGKGDDDFFFKYIKKYLRYQYGIDDKFNGWREQVDHYSSMNDVSWYNGFLLLLDEIWDNKLELSVDELPVDLDFPMDLNEPIFSIDNFYDSLILENGLEIKLGDQITLENKVSEEEYKKNKFYDAALREPNWRLFYPSDCDFRFVDFYTKRESDNEYVLCEKVRRIFGQSIVRIDKLGVCDGRLVVLAGPFKIDLESAFSAGEIDHLHAGTTESMETHLSSLVEDLKKYWSDKFFFPQRDSVADWCFHHFSNFNKEWQYFEKGRGGNWYMTERHPSKQG